ncbi:MAG: S41 family peptidase [Candidatus Electryonea clarkiae]|nr:S41 family peptidase [Candidatus Electryonea clarkiae]MDP8286631.1 S41 family peptidase [Candidatus Electryonea clarkiae]
MRSVRYLATAALYFGFLISQSMADPVFFPRRPGISPDGKTIAFTFQGDIWTVASDGGKAIRITANPSYDRNPVFSPDGSEIVFSSDRHGQYDLYVIPSTGGIPDRLTYAPTSEIPLDWSNDGSEIYFSSRRLQSYPMLDCIMKVPVSGGTPFRFTEFFARQMTVAPDGKSCLLAIGDDRFGRTGYRGTLQSDLWIWTFGTDPVQITDHPGYDTNPMWGVNGGSVYYRGEDDETGAFNIWRMNPDGSRKTRLTNFTEEGVRNARISRDGGKIVFEAGTDLYVLDTSEGAVAKKLNIEVSPDLVENPVQTKTFSAEATEVDVAEDGEELVLSVHGEIVLVNKELEGRATVPLPDPSRDNDIMFKPGTADTLIFVTDRRTNKGKRYISVAMLLSDDPDESNLRLARHHKIEYLTKEGINCQASQYSPKGDKIAYIEGKGDLHVMDADGKKDKTIITGWSYPSFSWSPDGRWIAYSREDRNYNQDIWIIPAEGGDAYNLSQHPDDDFGPKWSDDGRMIAWSTRRHGNEYDVYFAYLTRADNEMSREEWEIWEKTRDKPAKEDEADEDDEEEKEDDEEEKEEEELEVKIDFEDLYLRGRRVTSMSGDEFVVAIHPKGDKFVFSADVQGKRDLFTVNRFGEEPTNLTTGGADPSRAFLASDGSTIYFIKGGVPTRVGIDGGDVTATGFSARLTIDKPAERLQIMEEGWRRLGEEFYDPKLHGIDWQFMHKKISNIVSKVYADEDFSDAMNIMLRTLNASHMGYYPKVGRWTNLPGFLGIEFDPGFKDDGLKVKSVVPYGPADKEKTRLLPGDIILDIDGETVSNSENYYRTLVDKNGDPVLLNIKRGKENLEYLMIPVSWISLRQRIYKNMEKSNLATVENASKNRVGYVHIQGMGMREVELFERDLYAAADDKEALIIDVRDNGGGWTTDMLLTILTQPVHAYTIGRDGEVGYPQPRYPLYRWTKPIAVICNEGSYSNAEIFSHAVKTIGRGPVVGKTTGGNVISTSGWTALDGGHIRLPMRGWYVWGDDKNPARNNKNQEHGGAIPDYTVESTPGDLMQGKDPQLDKAVELMIQAADAEKGNPKPEPKSAAAAKR